MSSVSASPDQSGRDPIGMSASEDAARVAALRALGLLDTPPEDRFDTIARIAQRLFNVRSVGVNLVDRDRQFTKAALGDLALGDMPREESMCTFTVQEDALLEIPDAHADPAWASHPSVVGDLAIRFYAGVPLRTPGGERIGALCLIDRNPRQRLDDDEREMLDALAELVERELASTAEMEQGREVQRRLLPRSAPDLPGWEVAGTSRQRGAVGGDFYDWLVLESCVQLLLCDVMGKGLSAALLASGVRVVARGTSAHHTLASTVGRISEDLAVDLEETDSFVTAFLARIDWRDGDIEYVDAGHGLAFVVAPDGRHRRLLGSGLPIGALPGEEWEASGDRIAPGESLVVVSDGLLDLHADVDALMDAVVELLTATSGAPAPAEEVVAAIAHSGVGRAGDDVTVLLARRSAS